ncbi:hypothetical protein [Streptomyces sp. AA0539]|uniref:hypothetical protein n=1 Tax=Streptomyces sp. AA0539 TaxID=1210045 RepID=UPI0002DEDFC1|nr:hypothetical protein [Streptomyces sp. AA0539]
MRRSTPPPRRDRRTGLAVDLPLRIKATYCVQADGEYPVLGGDETLSDLLAPYGGSLVQKPDDQSLRLPYPSMATRLLAEAVADGARVDHVLLAYAIPSLAPSDHIGAALTAAGPEEPLVFAVSDQGTTAPYTALRLASEYQLRHRGQTLVIALDQAALPWPTPGTQPRRSAAYALLLDSTAGQGGVTLYQRTKVAEAEVADRLAEYLDHVHSRHPEPLAVTLSAHVPADGSYAADAFERGDPGLLCTSSWAALHEAMTSGARGTAVVVDYEPRSDQLSAAAFEMGRPAP